VKGEVCAVEVCFTGDGTHYYYTLLKNKNNKLALVESGVSVDNPNLPAVVLKNKIPLILIINGRGVILKKIALGELDPKNIPTIIRSSLPALNADEFFTQLYLQEDNSAYLAICRKEQVLNALSEFAKKNYEVAGLHIGAAAINGLKPLWQSFNALYSSQHKISLSNNVIDEIAPVETAPDQKITIDEISLSPGHTLGFASGLSYFMQRRISHSDDTQINQLATAHTEKNKFRFLMVACIGIAFVLAVTNVVFYTSFFDRNNKLESELSVYQGKYEKINQLLAGYQKNKELIENAGILGKNRLSEYSDRIGSTLPDEVTLCDLYFNPKKETDESADSLVTFDNKHITLKGNCSKSLIVNEWINVLKMQKFIKSVSLEKFVYNNEGLIPNFEIKLVTE
jgi:hypothetical protein